MSDTLEAVFGKAYSGQQVWGSVESQSGCGSELGATVALRSYLLELFTKLKIKKFLDAPCGDWNWMRHVDLSGVDYCGADVVPSVIARNQELYSRAGVRFIVADITKDKLPHADLILCRDCWIHLSFQDIAAVLENFRHSGATWLLVSNSPDKHQNINQQTGLRWRHLNLSLAPFHFPSSLESRKDHYSDTPFYITLWRIEDLPRIAIEDLPLVPQGVLLPSGDLAPTEEITAVITALVPPGGKLLLIDNFWLAPDQISGLCALRFLEHDGQYWGNPEDDDTAIRELERLRQSGVSHVVFGWPAFWWLDHYAGFHRFLRSRCSCVLENERLIIFDVRSAAMPMDDASSPTRL